MANRSEQLRQGRSSRLPPRAFSTRDLSTVPRIRDKDGELIRRGDQVFALMRGGRHEGKVEMIITGEEDEGVPQPPKVHPPPCPVQSVI